MTPSWPQEELSFYDLGVLEEDALFSSLWKNASVIESSRLEFYSNKMPYSMRHSEQMKRKCVTANCIVSYSKRILAYGLCCGSCGLRLKSTRQTTNLIIRDKAFHIPDLTVLSSIYLGMKKCLDNRNASVHLNLCLWNVPEKKVEVDNLNTEVEETIL